MIEQTDKTVKAKQPLSAKENPPVIGEKRLKEKTKKIGKVRLDTRLVELNLAPSREKAKAIIMAGAVLVDEEKIDKAGALVKPEANIRLLNSACPLPFVSRGGLKLKKALDFFLIDLNGLVMADIGASTGGFTDCALQHGAKKVYAIDVGYGQLAWALRTDSRVINLERTNIRQLSPSSLAEKLDFISIDVSFISLEKVLPVAAALLKNEKSLVALIKPQFEAGRGNVGKHGVVRDLAVHETVIKNISRLAKTSGLFLAGLTYSPIKGPEGNIEYLAHFRKIAKKEIAIGEEAVISHRETVDDSEISAVIQKAQLDIGPKTPAQTERDFLQSI